MLHVVLTSVIVTPACMALSLTSYGPGQNGRLPHRWCILQGTCIGAAFTPMRCNQALLCISLLSVLPIVGSTYAEQCSASPVEHALLMWSLCTACRSRGHHGQTVAMLMVTSSQATSAGERGHSSGITPGQVNQALRTLAASTVAHSFIHVIPAAALAASTVVDQPQLCQARSMVILLAAPHSVP